jgi:hypothetical protein
VAAPDDLAERAREQLLWRVANLGAFLAAWLLALTGLGLMVVNAAPGFDAHVYWTAWRTGSLYPGHPQLFQPDAFLYSPAFGQLLWLPDHLSFAAFRILASGASLLAYGWLLWPLPIRLRLPLLLACSAAIVTGNIWWAIAVTAIVGARWPAAWAIPALTKVTPAVGALWFVGRRDWGGLGIAIAVSLVIAAVSAVLDPVAWSRWFALLADNAAAHAGGAFAPGYLPDVHLLGRLAIAALLVTWGGWRGLPWTIVVAVTIAQPDASIDAFIPLVATLPRALLPQPHLRATGRLTRLGRPMLSSAP